MRARAPLALALFAALAFGTCAAPAARAAVITIVNADTAGEGFNDPTVVAPIGGNTGTTLGQQRLNVFQQAATLWGAILPSAVTIRVLASFDPQTCSPTSAVLGSAGAQQLFRDFPGAEWATTWYHGALANKRAGSDLSPSSDDIRARFNKDVDNGTCLGSTNWYYGYDGNEGSNVDLLPVVLHELGHGLGFSTAMNISTGQLAGGFPDVYMRFIRDVSSGLLWTSMSDGQRAASAVNTGNVVWDGTAVNEKLWSVLQMQPELTVTSPGGIAGTYAAAPATFGPPASAKDVIAAMLLANDGAGTTSDACGALTNAALMNGKIALVDGGNCTNLTKALNAQNAGAVAVVIASNVAGSTPPVLSGTSGAITIPVISVTQATGTTIKGQLGGGVSAIVRANPFRHVGASATNRALLYAPNPIQLGSSISHFDVSAVPNLLMEPIINSDLTSSVDLTRYALEDIGWFSPRTTDVAGAVAPGFTLANAPNPFRGATQLTFTLPHPGLAEVSVLDVSGRLVARLASQWMPAGTIQLAWNGLDGEGRRARPGVYLCRVKLGAEHVSRRLVVTD